MYRKVVTFMSCIFVSYLLYFASHPIAAENTNLETNSSKVNEIPEIIKLKNNGIFKIKNNKKHLETGASSYNEANGIEYENISVSGKERKAVKLTMKQGLIMNQIIATYALTDVKQSLCFNHTEEFKLGLRALEPWALQSMLTNCITVILQFPTISLGH